MTDEKNMAPLVSMQQELYDMREIDNQTKNVFYYDESNNCRKFCGDGSKQQFSLIRKNLLQTTVNSGKATCS
ncbi:hypothetical protein DW721_08385 [Clostridium sp. AM27-31LB]|uniref:hypothetical protein n=1 Tax=Clostridium sp. AM27-31LB TaxID=2293026 RepID=UPI000E4D4BD9|nr:hypothetical protein [Clostridium sp. AM27-31LB]RHT93494.1 hypothetical protein DW721_08385 [Clostridium sp. AM27-31LB]